MNTPSRGVRNNNPGNIDFNPRNDWQGQLGKETGPNGRFAVFDTPENGIRALGKLVINYRGKTGEPGVGHEGIDTVLETIHRWAPPVENDTGSYVASVAKAVGVKPTEPIDIRNPRTLTAMVAAIIQHENGYAPYTSAVIAEGVRRALA